MSKELILKHTGLTEKQFYAKYKTPEDFFNSKEGKAFQKMQGGGTFGFKTPGIPEVGYAPQNTVSPYPQVPNAPIAPNANYQGQANVQQQYGSGVNNPIPSPMGKPMLPTEPNQGEMNIAAQQLVRPMSAKNQGNIDANAGQQIIGEDIQPLDAASKGVKAGKALGEKGNFLKGLDPTGVSKLATSAISTFQKFKEQKKEAKTSKMWAGVTGLQAKAARTKPEAYDKMYDRKENRGITGYEVGQVGGVGTNVLTQNGGQFQGNPTEISNTYAPEDIYFNGGYEPLNDSRTKTYQIGGILNSVAGPANSAISAKMNNNAGYQLGDTVGQAMKFIPGVGPIISSIASPVLGAIGGQLDKVFGSAGKIAKQNAISERNVKNTGFAAQFDQANTANAAYVQNGREFKNPQILKYFGQHSLKELLKPDPMMDTLEYGGYLSHGGELQTHWGGNATPVSRNPYLPEGGETVKFTGNSHTQSDGRGNRGIGISFGDNHAEVENNEYAMKMADGGSMDNSMVVFGNIPIGKVGAQLIGNPDAAGRTVKKHFGELTKQEVKATKGLDKSTLKYNNFEPDDNIDKLTKYGLEAMMIGNNMSLKKIADEKQKLGHYQNAVNELKEELDNATGKKHSAEALSLGRLIEDQDPVTNGTHVSQNGKKMTTQQALDAGFVKNTKTGKWEKPGKSKAATASDIKKADALGYVPKGQHADPTGYWGGVTPEEFEQTKANNPWYDWTGFDPSDPNDTLNFQQAFNNKAIEIKSPARLFQDDRFGKQTASAKLNMQANQTPAEAEMEYAEVQDPTQPAITPKKDNWWDLLGAAIPYLRPSNAKGIDYNQLMGEMNAMQGNQVEPVQAIGYQPQLKTPFDISLQDQLNEVTKQTRGAQRMAGYNPAAQAMIAANAYDPANKILGEQFRLNQAEKDKVYGGNIDTMNDARLKNLSIFDQQQTRQSQARSNTKQINQAALASISDKYQKNALENKTLQTYENMYNYRFGPNMKAYNVNAPFNPNIPQVYNGDDSNNVIANATPVMDKKGNVLRYIQNDITAGEATEKPKKDAVTRNGSIVAALKRM